MNFQQLAIIGYGSQAKAWSANLRDSGHQIIIVLRKGSANLQLAKDRNFVVCDFDGPYLENIKNFALLTPDHTHSEILKFFSSRWKGQEKNIIYAHGFSYEKHQLAQLYPHLNHILLAPKAIASELRFQFENKGELTGVYSLPNGGPNQIEQVLALAKDLGLTKLYPSTFQEETYADLFSEQSILCSLIPYGAYYSYRELVKRGIPHSVAYTECWFEIKLIADAMIKYGPIEFFNLISPNALYGGEKGQKLFFDQAFLAKFESLADDIWKGDFFKELDQVDIEALRSKIIQRWEATPLSTPPHPA